MRRVLFRWRGRNISSYTAMQYVGLVLGVFAGCVAARASGLDPLRVYFATVLLIIPALIGARLLFVAGEWRYYRRHPQLIWSHADSGCRMYGAVPAMLVCSLPLLRALYLGFGAFWDVSVFTILVGMIFTRFGCLLNGCCSGRASRSWIGISLPNHMGIWEKRIPNQLLEAVCAAGLLALAIAIRRQLPFPGALFLVMVLGYSVVRFGMEFLREREPHARMLTLGHSASALAFLGAVTLLAAGWPR
jgi:phosphatidylglycerol---prolipoprotein diacylglyceryl transferase